MKTNTLYNIIKQLKKSGHTFMCVPDLGKDEIDALEEDGYNIKGETFDGGSEIVRYRISWGNDE